MRSTRILQLTLVVTALIAGPTAARAQAGLTVWAGAGGAAPGTEITFGKEAKQLGLQLALPILPIAIRGDVLMFGNSFSTDRLSYNLNAVLRMPLPIATPYAILGHGEYAVGPNSEVKGWNVGAGVRVGLGRLGVFGEVRKHDAIDRTITVLGFTF